MILTIELEGTSLEDLGRNLDLIARFLNEGYTSGEGWSVSGEPDEESSEEECQTCNGSGTDDDGIDCKNCQAREVCPRCSAPVEYVEPTPTDEAFRQCSRPGCYWRMC